MPLCDRLRINAGRRFIHSLSARVLVVLILIAIIAVFNLSKSISTKQNTNYSIISAKTYWENNDNIKKDSIEQKI